MNQSSLEYMHVRYSCQVILRFALLKVLVITLRGSLFVIQIEYLKWYLVFYFFLVSFKFFQNFLVWTAINKMAKEEMPGLVDIITGNSELSE